MKFGAPIFGYDHFLGFRDELRRDGFYTVNLGDNVQSIAVRRALTTLGVAASDIISVDRDSLRDYAGEPVRLVMNGVFGPHAFPPGPTVQPIFLGFSCPRETIEEHADYFRKARADRLSRQRHARCLQVVRHSRLCYGLPDAHAGA